MLEKIIRSLQSRIYFIYFYIILKKNYYINIKKIDKSASFFETKGLYFYYLKKILLTNNISNFRSNFIYKIILEHGSHLIFKSYRNYILKRKFKKFFFRYRKCFNNDVVGYPKLFKFNVKDNVNISISTIRYIATCLAIYETFKKKKFLRVVELGGGFGGQLICLNNFFKIKNYTIYDVKIVCKLIRKFLSEFKLDLKYKLSTFHYQKHKNIDLFLSNYSFSELDKNLQLLYLENIIKYAKNGFMVMNSGKKNSIFKDRLLIEDIKKYIPNLKTKENFIKAGTERKNYILYW